jgi:ABC-2 type transport system ATP-binding protein
VTTTTPTLELVGLRKSFGKFVAVDGVSLAVPPGTVFGLLGPNGAGKTTTIRMIMDIIAPDEGEVRFAGRPRRREDLEQIGYLPEERGLYKKMKVKEQLAFFGEARGIGRRDAVKKTAAWLDRLGLHDWADKKVEDLSKGMQQKVQFIGTLLHEPELVILDEPFSGLDPVNSQIMKDVVVDIARQGRTVLFSTHIMEQAEKMCDRIAIIARGEKIVDGALAEIKREFGSRYVALAFHRNAESAGRVLQDRRLVAKVDDYGASAEVELAHGAESEALLHALIGAGVGLNRFEVVEPSLQAIFIAKVGHAAATAVASGDDR